MTDVAVDVSGNIEVPPEKQSIQPSKFLPFPTQLPQAKEWVQQRRQNIRPWLQFVQTSNFKFPQSLPRLSRRYMRNIEYFQSNYIFVFLILIAYCLITSPLLLFALAGSFFVGYKLSMRHAEGKKVIVFGHELALAQQFGILSICSMPVFYIVGAGAAMFWVLGASFFLITLHAVFYNIDAVVEDESSFGLMENV
ncbi:hypothetical protein PPYR_03033 [Photinus pyralis]|uniref:PRA1 family protein n=1 Tax=Photinus pyralis TaxID=7054 RepID=A0A1Y1K4D3_PHOPY|nr:prenylated Rab acceptor protein 1 [Photinus pyralis]KAB0791233.1 hypothetical protein PPYR_03033 [Photinus pyralis]